MIGKSKKPNDSVVEARRKNMNPKQTILAILKHDIIILVLLGVALRIVLMPFFIDPYDIVAQQLSFVAILNHYDPYSLSVSMYPPFIYMLFYPFLLIASRAGFVLRLNLFPATFSAGEITGMVTSFFGDPVFLFVWKFPLLIFDCLTGLLIYYLTKELTQDASKARWGFILWFFNPFVLITSYIHGAFDVIAAFFILLGIYFLLKNKYLLSGISLGLGGITKVSPALIAIPLSFLIFFEKTDESLSFFSRRRLHNFFTFIGGCLIPILISILWNIDYFHLLFTSTLGEISINGGLNQWFFAINWNLRSSLLNPNLDILKGLFYLYPLISLIPLFFLRKALWNRRISSHVVLLLSALSLLIVYFVSPLTVQPQYMLWLIPILTVISMKNRSFYWPLGILSFASCAFFFSLQSPFAFMYPLALFTPIVSVNQLNAAIIYYATRPGIFCPLLWLDLCLVFGAVGFFGLVLTVVSIAREIRKAIRYV